MTSGYGNVSGFITTVLRRNVPGPYRHCENGASIRNLKPLAIFCGRTARFVSDLVGNPDERVSYDAARSTLTLIGRIKVFLLRKTLDECYCSGNKWHCPGNKNEGSDKR